MGVYYGNDKTGALNSFTIKGDQPSPEEMSRITAILNADPQADTPKAPEKEPAQGLMAKLGNSFMSSVNQSQAGLDTFMQSIHEIAGDPEGAKAWEEGAKRQRAEAAEYPVAPGGFLSEVGTTVAGSAPAMIAGLGGRWAGAEAGAAIGAAIGAPFGGVGAGPGAVVGGIVGAALGGFAGYAPQMLNSNAERQIQTHGAVKDWGKAYAATGTQAALETLVDTFQLRLLGTIGKAGSKVLGKAADKTIRKSADAVAKKVFTSAMAKGMTQEAALSFTAGALEESLQQGAERWNADLPLLDEQAQGEYIHSAIMGGIVESLFGAGVGAYAGHVDDKTEKAKRAAKEHVDAEYSSVANAAAAYEPQYAKKRGGYTEPPKNEEDPTIAGKTPDPHAATSEEELFTREERNLPAGLRGDPSGDGKPPPPGGGTPSPAPGFKRFFHGGEDANSGGSRWVAPNADYAENFRTMGGAKKKLWYVDVPIGHPAEVEARNWTEEDEKNGINNVGSYRNANFPEELAVQLKPFEEISLRDALPKKPTTRAERLADLQAYEASKRAVPTVTAPVASQVTPTPVIGEEPVKTSFGTETEYRNAVDKLSPYDTVSLDRIMNVMKVKKPQAMALFDEMLRRRDAHPAGNQSQYISVIKPHGAPATPGGKPRRSRKFQVRAVPSPNAKPYSVSVDGKKLVKSFATQEEAQAHIDTKVPETKRSGAAIINDNPNQMHGLYETHTDPTGAVIEERLVSSHPTMQEANDALAGHDNAYSAESNKWRAQQPVATKQSNIEKDIVDEDLGAIAKILKALGERIVGKDRVDVNVVPRITPKDRQGNEIAGAVAEGHSQNVIDNGPDGIKKVIRNLITLANDLYNPSLSVEDRAKLMQSVFNHELIHALRSLDLLTRQEWTQLFQHAVDQKVPGQPFTWMQLAEARTRGQNPSRTAEEAIAEMFRHYLNDPTSFRNPTRGLLERLADFVKKMVGLGKRHDAADLMDTIFEGGIADREIGHGGLGYRGAEDVFFSLLKTDNFYLGADKFLTDTTIEKAKKNDWIKMLSDTNSGIKKSELDWLQVVPWLQSLPKDEPIHKLDILNFVKASSPKVSVTIKSRSTHPDFGPHSVGAPAWESRTSAVEASGPKNYAEAYLTFAPIKGEPLFRGGVHATVLASGIASKKGQFFQASQEPIPNVLAIVRMRDVWKGSRRLLFIEEIQSDLHQKGGTNGYYSKTADDRIAALQERVDAVVHEMFNLKQDRANIYAKVMSYQTALDANMTKHDISRDEEMAMRKQNNDWREQADVLTERIKELDKSNKELGDRINRAETAQTIPNAPFKTNWEDYVIRRLARHAAEHNYDGLVFHGSPESVAATQGYGELTEVVPEKGKKQYYAGRSETSGGVSVTPIVNRYTITFPKVTGELADTFGTELEHNVMSIEPLVDENGKPMATRGGYVPADVSDYAMQGRWFSLGSMIENRDRYNDIVSRVPWRTPSDSMEAAGISRLFDKLVQIARQMRQFDAAEVIHIAKAKEDHLMQIIRVLDTNDYYGTKAATDVGSYDPDNPFIHDHYIMGINREMRDGMEYGELPFFSMLQARTDEIKVQPNFQLWFDGGVVREENGDPKVVYHFTQSNQPFGRFHRLTHFGTAAAAEKRWMMKQRFTDQQGSTHPVFLNLRRPLHIKDDKSNHNAFSYGMAMMDEGVLSEARFREINALRTNDVNIYTDAGEQEALTELVKELEKAGYDGFSYINAGEDPGSMSYVALHPMQIKSIFNRGTWSHIDPDTLYSMASKPTGYQVDNPGGDWLAGKQRVANALMAEGKSGWHGLNGTPTATAGMGNDPLFLPVSELVKLPGRNGEQPAAGQVKYDAVAKSFLENGYTNENPIFVMVNHKGQAFLNEGNNRVAVAAANGVQAIKAWVHWMNGAELTPGDWSPQKVASMENRLNSVLMRPDMLNAMDDADQSLPPKAQKAITSFVAHEPMSRDKDWMSATAIMDAEPLEAAMRGEDPETADQIEKAFAPFREKIRRVAGGTVRLYRVQHPVERKPDTIYHGFPKDGKRAVLSWTVSPEFATAYSGARPDRKIFNNDEIDALEQEHATNGVVKIPGTSYQLQGLNHYTDFKGNPRTSIDLYGSDGHITDTESVREFVEGLNEDRLEMNRANAAKRQRIVTADVSLDDVVWVTDRAGQKEFIVRNDPNGSAYIDEKGVHQNAPTIEQQNDKEADDAMYSLLQDRGADLWENDDKFKHWFSGSRVVDEEGNPLLMFHGTTGDFDTFDIGELGKNDSGWFGTGFYFETDPEIASKYARRHTLGEEEVGGHVIPVYLSIKNPYIWPSGQNAFTTPEKAAKFVSDLKASGFDGVMVPSRGFEVGEKDAPRWREVVAFAPGQIKSALSEQFSTEEDSYRYSMVTPPLYSTTAALGQRVPINTPIDRLQELHNKILYDNLSPVFHKFADRFVPGTKLKAAFKKGVDSSIISLQDNMLSFARLIDRMKKNGGFISNENDVYLRHTLFSSQTDAQLMEAERDLYKPMMETVKGLRVTRADYEEAKTLGPRIEEFLDGYKVNPQHALSELYLYARHAQERNAVMRERNDPVQMQRPDQYQAGSGMGDGDAVSVLQWFDSKPFGAQFSSLTDPTSVRMRMREINRSLKEIRVDGDLTPDFGAMTYADGTPVEVYEDYVPIRGFLGEASIRDEDIDDFARTGMGFNIRGKEDFSALGRESMGRDLIAHAMMQHQEAIVRAQKNKVTKAFRQLILDNPAEMAPYAEIIQMPKMKWTLDRKRGVVTERVDQNLANQPNVLKGKLEGDVFYIKMKDERVAKAMGRKTGLGNTGLEGLIKGLTKVNRLLAMTRTSLSPEFMINNFLRDAQTAWLNLSEYEVKGMKSKVRRSVFPAMNGVRRALQLGDRTHEWAKVFEEFQHFGGHTASFGIKRLAETMETMNQHFQEDFSGGPNKIMKPLRWTKKLIEDYNLAIESGTRLAAYKELRDYYLQQSGDPTNPVNQMRAKELAAFGAKNMTVNFNAGGDAKGVLTAFYLFFNASMQGSMAMINPFIRNKKMRKIWGGVLVAGMVQDMLMSMLSPEDDDGENIYDKIPDYILEHNMIFMDPFGMTERGYMKIPMPYLMNGIWNWGRNLAKLGRGKASIGDVMSSGGMTMVDSLNPWGGSNSWLNWVAPTIIDPIVDLTLNEDFTGKPVAPPLSPYDNVTENRSQQFWNNTNPIFVTVADMMSQLTGREGDYIPGYAEFSPNQIEYVWDWLTGGTGTFVARASREAFNVATGNQPDEFDFNDIPIARKFLGSITTKNDLQDFIEGRDKVLRIRKALQDARKEGDKEAAMAIMRKYPKEHKAAARVNAIENARKKLSHRIKMIRDNPRMSQERKDELVKKAKEKQNMLVGKGNMFMAEID